MFEDRDHIPTFLERNEDRAVHGQHSQSHVDHELVRFCEDLLESAQRNDLVGIMTHFHQVKRHIEANKALDDELSPNDWLFKSKYAVKELIVEQSARRYMNEEKIKNLNKELKK